MQTGPESQEELNQRHGNLRVENVRQDLRQTPLLELLSSITLGYRLLRPRRTFTPILVLRHFVLELLDRRTGKRTGSLQARPVMRLR